MIAELVGDVQGLDGPGLLGRFRELEATARRLEAEFAAVVGEVDRRSLYRDDGHASVRGWLRARGGWSDTLCTRRVRLAKLTAAQPAVADALTDGMLGVPQADEIARAHSNPRCGREVGAVLDVLLGEAARLEFDQFRVVVRRWETLADTDGAHRDRDLTHAARRASLVDHDGVSYLNATGGAVDGAAMAEIFDRFCRAEFLTDHEAAKARWGDQVSAALFPRTDTQRRFDALRAIFEAAASAPADAVAPEPVVNIVVDYETFLTHLARRRLIQLRPDALPSMRLTDRRCETTSGIPVTPEDALRAAMAGHVRRVVLDSAGLVVDLGRKRRLFTGAAAAAARLTNPTCAHRGCQIPARRCDLDHLTDWQHHGDTNQDNTAPRCPRHHRAKQQGFRIRRDPHGHWHTYRPDGTEIT